MDISRLPESMRARIEARNALSPLDRVREFLDSFVLDVGGIEEIRAEIREAAGYNTIRLSGDLIAIDALLAEAHPPNTLAHLVGWDANRVLDDPSDEGAAQFLRELAEMVRQVISEHE